MMQKKRNQLFGIGALIGLTCLSISLASVPSKVTDDTAIYQNLSEIRVSKEAKPNFDGDIGRLSALEGRYREALPSLASHPRLRGPMQRIAKQQYHPTRAKKQVATSRQ